MVFRRFDTLGEAAIIQGLLQANDIPCFLSNVSNVLTPGLYASWSVVELRLFEKDVERAEALLDAAEIAGDAEALGEDGMSDDAETLGDETLDEA